MNHKEYLKEYMKKYFKDEKNRKKNLERINKYKKTPEGKLKYKICQSKWLKRNPNYMSEYCKKWRKRKKNEN